MLRNATLVKRSFVASSSAEKALWSMQLEQGGGLKRISQVQELLQ